MRFAHMADCHIGSWRDPKLNNISTDAFSKAVDISIEKKVDFVIIAGDLFNTSLPPVEKLKTVVMKLKALKKKDIPVYIVPGSHDFSPSGKTMLDVLEEAELLVNVVKGDVSENKLKLRFTVDKKTGAKITGMLGRRGMLEKKYYESLDKTNLEKEDGFRIFVFHTAISELMPAELKQMESAAVSLLPKGFDYYAGGHVHIVEKKELPDYKNIIYPGPLFPNSFSELEKLQQGGFYIYDKGKLEYEPVQIYNIHSIILDCKGKTPEQVTEKLKKEAEKNEFINTIVTIRLSGKLASGKIADIDFKEIIALFYKRGAYFVMKNANKVQSRELEDIRVRKGSVEEVESSLIKEHLGQIKVEGMDTGSEEQLTKSLMQALNAEKQEGERNIDFERRIRSDISRILELDEAL